MHDGPLLDKHAPGPDRRGGVPGSGVDPQVRRQLRDGDFLNVDVSSGSGSGLDERRLCGSPTRLAGFGQRVQRIGWPDPTLG